MSGHYLYRCEMAGERASERAEHHYCDHRGMYETAFITYLKTIKIQFPAWRMPISPTRSWGEGGGVAKWNKFKQFEEGEKRLRHAAI